MKLTNVIIKNFRSIEKEEITFDIPFRILVGKNESGKSNILKALALLDKDAEIKKEDIREGIEFENKIDSEILYEFDLSEEEIEEVYKSVKEKTYSKDANFDELKICKIEDETFTLKELCYKYNTAIYSVSLNRNVKTYTYYTRGSDWTMLQSNLMFNSQKNRLSRNFYPAFQLIDVLELTEEDKTHLTKLTGPYLNIILGSSMAAFIKLKHPKVINWSYKEADLLTDNIDIDAFISNPNEFEALKTMFELAGIEDIKTSLGNVRQLNFYKLNNYLDKIAEKTTAHFKKVWKEYKDIEFTLNANANSIVPGIKEKNTFAFQQRSDGFKRFVTFLLLISAVYETDSLSDTLLLIDEPDISLHPSGVKYLRDELIKISEDNYIVASTHSIFLIDGKNIKRHYIVEKEHEITKIQEATDENFVSEEVLYNALGFSFFEILKEENLVFEGWRDKELFKKALERVPNEYKEIKNSFKDFGIAHINGVKEGQAITPIFELTGRRLVVISDSDDIAIQYKKNFEKNCSYGKWLTYSDIDEELKDKTGEDFLKIDYFKSSFASFRKKHPELEGNPLFETPPNRLKVVDEWLKKDCNIMDTAKRKEFMQELKLLLFNDLKNSNIDAKYYEFLVMLGKKIKTLPN